MKKILCLLIVLSVLTVPTLALPRDIGISVNGEQIEFPDVQPTDADGVIFAPVRAVFEALGAGVYWEESDKMVFINYGDDYILLQIDSNIMFLNDELKMLTNAPRQVNDMRTVVDLKEVLEHAGITAVFDGGVNITK